MNFANSLDNAATEAPGDLAVTDPRRERTYEALAAETDAFANVLVDLGVARGNRVALYPSNSAESSPTTRYRRSFAWSRHCRPRPGGS